MNEIRFTTVIGEDQVIRPPEGISLSPGKAEVIVKQPDDAAKDGAQPVVAKENHLFDRLSKLAESLHIDPTDLPADLAENHDYYLHGLSKGIDSR